MSLFGALGGRACPNGMPRLCNGQGQHNSMLMTSGLSGFSWGRRGACRGMLQAQHMPRRPKHQKWLAFAAEIG